MMLTAMEKFMTWLSFASRIKLLTTLSSTGEDLNIFISWLITKIVLGSILERIISNRLINRCWFLINRVWFNFSRWNLAMMAGTRFSTFRRMSKVKLDVALQSTSTSSLQSTNLHHTHPSYTIIKVLAKI